MPELSANYWRRGAIGAALLAAVGTAWLGPPRAAAQGAAPDYAALMAAPDRSEADREADKRRDPVPFLAFAGLRPGMKVLDMGAGAGYSTELMARAWARTARSMARIRRISASAARPRSRPGWRRRR